MTLRTAVQSVLVAGLNVDAMGGHLAARRQQLRRLITILLSHRVAASISPVNGDIQTVRHDSRR